MDFVSDQLANGRRFQILNIVDDYSREIVLDSRLFNLELCRSLGKIPPTVFAERIA